MEVILRQWELVPFIESCNLSLKAKSRWRQWS